MKDIMIGVVIGLLLGNLSGIAFAHHDTLGDVSAKLDQLINMFMASKCY